MRLDEALKLLHKLEVIFTIDDAEIFVEMYMAVDPKICEILLHHRRATRTAREEDMTDLTLLDFRSKNYIMNRYRRQKAGLLSIKNLRNGRG